MPSDKPIYDADGNIRHINYRGFFGLVLALFRCNIAARRTGVPITYHPTLPLKWFGE